MSDLNLENIVGFKAVDKNGNERQVTVDEMTELVSARIVSAASEISTFAAAAAAGTDEFEDQLPQSDTFSWLRTLDGSKNPTLTSSSAAAKVLGELIGINDTWIRRRFAIKDLHTAIATNKDGLMSKNGFLERSKGNTLDFNDYTISGVWVFSDTGFINGPSVYRGGILLVFKTANGNILQICCDYTNSENFCHFRQILIRD